jgi:hypothetical protein
MIDIGLGSGGLVRRVRKDYEPTVSYEKDFLSAGEYGGNGGVAISIFTAWELWASLTRDQLSRFKKALEATPMHSSHYTLPATKLGLFSAVAGTKRAPCVKGLRQMVHVRLSRPLLRFHSQY